MTQILQFYKKYSDYNNFLAIIIFLAPLYLLRFSIFNIPTNFLEISILIVLFFYLIFSQNNKTKIQIEKKYLILIAFLFLGLISSAFYNQNLMQEFGIIKSWFVFPLIFSFLLIKNVKNIQNADKILKAYFFSASIISLLGLFFIATNRLTFDGRLEIFYTSPNYLAMFLASAVLIGFYFLHSKPASKTLLIIQIIILINLYFTYSYSAWIAIIFSTILFFLIINKNIFDKKKIIFFSLLILLLTAFQINNQKIQDIFNPKNHSSLESRFVIWHSTTKIITDNFWLGIGPGNFQEKYLEYQKYFPPYPEWAVPHPHNIFLAFWLQSGLIGLVSFVLLIIFWLQSVFSKTSKQKNASQKRLGAFLIIVILYFLIHGMIDTTYWKNDLSLYFWIFFSLGIFFTNIKD
ncbi:MAG: O-antigen polymerase [Candidatus Moranbacteria bacterium GW2011_GWE2_35_2-]|nr:MAG: O-antigen polymerase [Candidatus Moranbacteria bacterium GW2011_GWE2_35_2-]KKQ06662.1 MAG: O-antigen polymerase [Candidatus Moranbacteria bacterium GW2011_GWF1_36_4]KKQ22615.1 MAG: O-antigen polymerase [Candidatus Moranbacteria bacterium GW2011_GWF2_37_11]KKQ29018.1 MAG: O-antigen polymerase [Candidatus Moranbacteria bacterium GW2011_GWD1_37_17]KKQ30446.1 MAG: O-antigen polymerase [Candidatus Moranbacteria bacterium GW2011_GWE1_37_24]KKQ47926.1 MAG: O-antigen polymerase [Candidatus Mor